MHVLADALTSVLVITALFAGNWAGLNWLDAIMGIVGAGIISVWSYSMVKQTSPVLRDSRIPEQYRDAIKHKIEQDADNRVADFHVWVWAVTIMQLLFLSPPPAHYSSCWQKL